MNIQIDNYYISISSTNNQTLMSICIDGQLIIHKSLFGNVTRESAIKIAVDSISIYNSLHGCNWGEYAR